MCFKIMRLIGIRNRPKRTISVSGELELLQMISKPKTWQCASEDAGLKGGEL